jgi:hypothetical protein
MTALRWPCLILLTMLAVACGDAESTATDLRLADLVRFQDRYDGETVAITGVVHSFSDPEHYWVEDDRVNRVRIEPHAAVSDLVGEHVRVIGRFEYASGKGRVIHARNVEVLD